MYDVPAFIIKWIIIVLVTVALEMAQPNISLMWTPGERFFKSIIIAPSILWQLMDLITRFESHAQVYNIMVTGEAMKSKSLRCGNWFPFLYSVCFSGYRTTVSFHSNHTEKKKGEKKKAIFLPHTHLSFPLLHSYLVSMFTFRSSFFLSFTLPEKFPSMTETYSKSSQRGGQPRKVVRRESLAIKNFQKNIISFHIWMFMHPFSHLLIRIKHKIQVVKGRRWSMWLQFQLTNAGWLNGVAWKQKLTSIFRQCWESKAIWDKIARIGGAKTARMGCLFFLI